MGPRVESPVPFSAGAPRAGDIMPQRYAVGTLSFKVCVFLIPRQHCLDRTHWIPFWSHELPFFQIWLVSEGGGGVQGRTQGPRTSCPLSWDPRVQQQASRPEPILLTCVVISVASVTQPSGHSGKRPRCHFRYGFEVTCRWGCPLRGNLAHPTLKLIVCKWTTFCTCTLKCLKEVLHLLFQQAPHLGG